MWEVYIIRTESGKLYTGITNDLERRFEAHCKLKSGAKYFRFSQPQSIVFREKCANRSEAAKKEIGIKKMNRTKKLQLIYAAHYSSSIG